MLLRPLQLDTSDPSIQSKAQEYYDGLLDELRTVPGLVLVGADAPADFRITVTGTDGRNSEYLAGVAMWQVSLEVETWRGDAYRQEGQPMGSGGTLGGAACVPEPADRLARCKG